MSRRDHLIHGYDAVDHQVLWNAVRLDLPGLIRAIHDLLQ